MQEGTGYHKTSLLVKLIRAIPVALTVAFATYLCITIFLCAFMTRVLGPERYAYFTLNNVLFFAIAIAILFVLFVCLMLCKKFNIKAPSVSSKIFVVIVILCTVAMFFYYWFLINNITYVDVGDVFNVTLKKFTNPEIIEGIQKQDSSFYRYFSSYPNLQFMLGMFYKIYCFFIDNNIAKAFLILRGEPAININLANVVYMFTQFVGCACVWSSCVLVSIIVKSKINNLAGIFAMLFGIFFIGISPTAIIPYSDSYSILFTTGILAIYILAKNRYFKISGIIVLAIIGYSLKPTVLAIFGAIVLVEICNWTRKKISIKIASFSIIASVLSATCAFCFVGYVKDIGTNYNDDQQLTFTHYLLLGSNKNSDGIFNSEDYDFSMGAENVEERQQKDLEKVASRLEDMGFLGTLNHYVNKNIQNYANGTMRPFYFYDNVQNNDNENPFLTYFYGLRSSHGHENYKTPNDQLTPYNVCTQVAWFLVLIGCVVAGIIRRRDKTIQTVSISLLVLSVFLIIFEASCRYLFLYRAIFMFAGIMGLWYLAQWINSKFVLKN